MGSGSPKVRDRSTDGSVVLVGVRIHVSCICDLAFGGGVDQVDLGAGERLQRREVEGLGERVNASMLEQLISSLINFRGIWISLQVSGIGDFAGKVVASVQVFEEASYGIEVFVNQVYSTVLKTC